MLLLLLACAFACGARAGVRVRAVAAAYARARCVRKGGRAGDCWLGVVGKGRRGGLSVQLHLLDAIKRRN